MKAGNALLRSDEIRFLFAFGVAFDVLIVVLSVVEPWLGEGDRGGADTGARAAHLVASWPYLALGATYALAAHATLHKFDAHGAIAQVVFCLAVGGVALGTLVTTERDFGILAESSNFNELLVAHVDILAAVIMLPASAAVFLAGLFPPAYAVFRRAFAVLAHH